jgi:hypothetical protein
MLKLPFHNNELPVRNGQCELSSRVIYRSCNVFLSNRLTNRLTFGIHTEQIFALRPHRLAWPRTSAFHAENRGSNPRGDAMQKFAIICLFRAFLLWALTAIIGIVISENTGR